MEMHNTYWLNKSSNETPKYGDILFHVLFQWMSSVCKVKALKTLLIEICLITPGNYFWTPCNRTLPLIAVTHHHRPSGQESEAVRHVTS